MLAEQDKLRYDRHIRLNEVGEQGQQKLLTAKVLVVGAGGLGCPVLQYLAAAGVGTIGVMDADSISVSNLQRQPLFATADIDKPKSTTAIQFLEKLNPNITFTDYPFYLQKENALAIIEKYDIVVDCTDNFSARYLINDACVLLNKPFVYGALYKFEGQLSVFNYKGGATYRCLYPVPPNSDQVPNCSQIGVIGVLPALIGVMQATEVVKIIVELGTVLSGKLLTYDTLQNTQQIIKFSKSENTVSELTDYNFSCTLANDNEILVAELKAWFATDKKFNLIDIRESYEREEYKLNDTHAIPMGALMTSLDKIDKQLPTVIYCQTGTKSKAVVGMLKKQDFTQIYSLVNGVHQWVSEEVNP